MGATVVTHHHHHHLNIPEDVDKGAAALPLMLMNVPAETPGLSQDVGMKTSEMAIQGMAIQEMATHPTLDIPLSRSVSLEGEIGRGADFMTTSVLLDVATAMGPIAAAMKSILACVISVARRGTHLPLTQDLDIMVVEDVRHSHILTTATMSPASVAEDQSRWPMIKGNPRDPAAVRHPPTPLEVPQPGATLCQQLQLQQQPRQQDGPLGGSILLFKPAARQPCPQVRRLL